MPIVKNHLFFFRNKLTLLYNTLKWLYLEAQLYWGQIRPISISWWRFYWPKCRYQNFSESNKL